MTQPSRPAKGRTRRRSAGEGSVYQTGDRWRGAVTWTDAAGQRHRRTCTARTQAGARKKLDELRGELGVGALDPDKPMTVGEYLDGWILRLRPLVRPATFRQRDTHVRLYLKPALGKVPLAKLTAERIELALATFQKEGRPDPTRGRRGRPPAPLSPLSVSHIRTTLRRALADAERDGKVSRNAASAARPPRVPKRSIVYLSARDVRRLLEATADLPDGPIIALAVTTGLRLGELLGLTWGDISDGKLSVRHSLTMAEDLRAYEIGETKTMRSRRTIPLPMAARQALETQRTRQMFARQRVDSAWQDRIGVVFTDDVGRPMQPWAVSRRFTSACALADVPHVRFHDLRHTAATLMLAQGVPLAVISEWLGHTSITITADLYAAIVPELHLEAADAMDRAIGGAS